MNAEDRDLLMGYLNGVLNDGEMARIERLLLENPRVALRLAELSMVECMLYEMGLQAGDMEEAISSVPFLPHDLQPVENRHDPAPVNAGHVDVAEIRRRAERQLQADLAEQEALRRQQQDARGWSGQFSFDLDAAVRKVQAGIRFARRAVLTTACLAVVGLLVTGGVKHARTRQVVAHLGDTVQAKWADPPQEAQLRRGWLQLDEGFAQLKFAKGAEVILQAPCTFELRSSRSMFLASGTLTARIISPHAHGFIVDTPNSQLVDFGTEFGVLVDEGNNSEVHVFNGRVRLRAVHAVKHKGDSRELTDGQRARVDREGEMTVGALEERLFYRSLPSVNSLGIPGKRLDLADILGGGNGFGTGRMQCAIDPLTGRATVFNRWNYRKKGRGEYTLVEHNVFVDGVFIPDGGADHPVVASSGGHIFQECPETNGQADGDIQNTHSNILFHTPPMTCRPRLGDRIYDTAAHPHIYMQANVGLTFDLDAMRSRLTANSIRRFTSQCGVCAEIPKDDEEIDFWVLVDGQVRFVRQDVTKAEGIIQVDVPLHEQDRFLTLVVTQGTDGSMWDLGLFAEPAVELGPMDRKPE